MVLEKESVRMKGRCAIVELKEAAPMGTFQKHVLIQLLIEDSLAGVTWVMWTELL